MKEMMMFIADDGKMFTDRRDCFLYEEDIRLHKANAGALKIAFQSPLTTIDCGNMVLFHAENDEEYHRMTDHLSGNDTEDCKWKKEVYDSSPTFPNNFVAVIPEDYDWVQIEKFSDVKEGLFKMLSFCTAWERGDNHD